jgi:Uma2 family endonuclease
MLEHAMVTLVIPTDAISVKGPPQGQWTYADWETLLDDGNRYEVIDGVLYMSTAPSYFHQWIIRRLDRFVGVPAEEQGLAFAATAPVGVLMPGCEPVQPDFVLVLAARKSIIHDRRIRGVPDLIIEVLSPGNSDFDKEVKLAAYANAGVPEYDIIDPAEKTLSLYTLQKPGQYSEQGVYKEGDMVTFSCLPTIPLEISSLFADSLDTTL